MIWKWQLFAKMISWEKKDICIVSILFENYIIILLNWFFSVHLSNSYAKDEFILHLNLLLPMTIFELCAFSYLFPRKIRVIWFFFSAHHFCTTNIQLKQQSYPDYPLPYWLFGYHQVFLQTFPFFLDYVAAKHALSINSVVKLHYIERYND